MHELKTAILERVASGLQRRALTTCSRWACARRVMGSPFPGAWTFKHHPWLREMHDSEAELNVGQKSAQMGFTETVLNITFFNIDVKGIDVLYVLPAKNPDASDFSSGRFDPALELSPHLNRLFSDVQNVGHKRAGARNLYIRGSRSRAGLKSVPVGQIILDELDEMTQENIPLALERISGQIEKSVWMVSTPTIDNSGINKYYLLSSQNHFHFPCPSCSRWIELKFPESLVIVGTDYGSPEVKESHLICDQCKAKLPHETKTDWLKLGKWIPSYSDRDSQGWHINQLYSTTVSPVDLANAHLLAQLDRAAEQEFFNSKLGVPHVVDGARVTDAQIDESRGGHKHGEVKKVNNPVTMGVDVGAFLHFHIDEWHLPGVGPGGDLSVLAKRRCLHFGKVRDFEELDGLMFEFNISFAVLDSQPETRKVIEFCNRFFGRARRCYYVEGITGKTIHLDKEEAKVSVDRTSWLDLSLGRFRNRSIVTPCDIDMEYRSHMKALVRIYEYDKNGNPVGRYVKGNDADHYAHASNYSEIALPLAVSLHSPQDIRSLA